MTGQRSSTGLSLSWRNVRRGLSLTRAGAFIYVVLVYLAAAGIAGLLPIVIAIERAETVTSLYTAGFIVGITLSVVLRGIVASLFRAESEHTLVMTMYLIGITMVWGNLLFPEPLLNLLKMILPQTTFEAFSNYLSNFDVNQFLESRFARTALLTRRLTIAASFLFVAVGSLQTICIRGGFRAFAYSLLQVMAIGLACILCAFEAGVLPQPVTDEIASATQLVRGPTWSLVAVAGALYLFCDALFLRAVAARFDDSPTLAAASGYRTFTVFTVVVTAGAAAAFAYFGGDSPIIEQRGQSIDVDYARLSSLAALGLLLLIHATMFQRTLADVRDVIDVRRQG